MLRRLGLGDTLGELFRRPLLLVEALRVFVAMRRRRRLLPSRAYLRWRAYTAYGDHNAPFRNRDVVHFLEWRRQWRRGMKIGSAR